MDTVVFTWSLRDMSSRYHRCLNRRCHATNGEMQRRVKINRRDLPEIFAAVLTDGSAFWMFARGISKETALSSDAMHNQGNGFAPGEYCLLDSRAISDANSVHVCIHFQEHNETQKYPSRGTRAGVKRYRTRDD